MIRLALVVLVACGSVDAPIPPQTNLDLVRIEKLNHGWPLPYSTHVDGLIDTCCPQKPWERPPIELAAVCRELQRDIENGGHATSLPLGPHCRAAISTDTLLISLRHPKRQGERTGVVQLLAEREPNEHVQRELFRELLTLEMPSDDPRVSGVDDLSRILPRMLTVAIAVGGEAELRSIAPLLHSDDSHERLWATHVMMYATVFPIDLPELLPSIDRLANDPDERIAGRARQASAQYRLWSRFDIDAWAGAAASIAITSTKSPGSPDRYPPMTSLAQVLQYQDIDGKLLALQLFGRRTAFCSSRVATAILKTLERDGDPSYADLAKRAAELRRERCRDV